MDRAADTHDTSRSRTPARSATETEAIFDAVDVERRRIERDLHDGTQQFLTSAMMLVQQARVQFMSGDCEVAAELLALAMDRLLDTAQELRRVNRTIYPALLNQVGLLGTLESLIDRSPLEIEFSSTPLPSLPEAVERAAYFVTAEALTNVIKHARTSRVDVRIGIAADGGLELSISDSGTGELDELRGSGLRGLRERLAAQGGVLTVVGRRGYGSTVTARWPAGAATAVEARGRFVATPGLTD